MNTLSVAPRRTHPVSVGALVPAPGLAVAAGAQQPFGGRNDGLPQVTNERPWCR
jgi:hypothetical protein